MAFNPSSLSPFFWIDFSNSGSLTLVDGLVSQANDLGASGRSFSQSTAAARPALASAAINGLNAARFDGVNDRLSSNSNTNLRTFTLLIAASVSSNAAINYPFIVSKASYYATDVNDFPFSLQASKTPSTLTALFNNGASWNYAVTVTSDANTIAPDTPFFAAVEYTPERCRLWVNQVLVKDVAGNGTIVSANSRYWTLGNTPYDYLEGTGKVAMKGDIGEIMLLSYIPTADQWRDINAYFTTKWMPTGTLSGTVTVSGNGGADQVVIRSASNRQLVALATPDETTGDWSASVPPGDYDISYFAPNCQPICHGPYTVTA